MTPVEKLLVYDHQQEKLTQLWGSAEGACPL